MTAMDVARSSHWWLGKFAARLIRLNPNASSPCAIRRAVANYDKAAHLDPEFAADVYYRKAVAAEIIRQSTRGDMSDNPEARKHTRHEAVPFVASKGVAPKTYMGATSFTRSFLIGAMR